MSDNSLLDYIAVKIGCECLSDLRYDAKFWFPALKNVVKNINADDYPVSQWKEAVSYVNDSKCDDMGDFQEAEKIKEYMMKILNKKSH